MDRYLDAMMKHDRTDVPAAERTSREGLLWAAHSYFDALEGDSGKIGAFADDCVRHENGHPRTRVDTWAFPRPQSQRHSPC